MTPNTINIFIDLFGVHNWRLLVSCLWKWDGVRFPDSCGQGEGALEGK